MSLWSELWAHVFLVSVLKLYLKMYGDCLCYFFFFSFVVLLAMFRVVV